METVRQRILSGHLQIVQITVKKFFSSSHRKYRNDEKEKIFVVIKVRIHHVNPPIANERHQTNATYLERPTSFQTEFMSSPKNMHST